MVATLREADNCVIVPSYDSFGVVSREDVVSGKYPGRSAILVASRSRTVIGNEAFQDKVLRSLDEFSSTNSLETLAHGLGMEFYTCVYSARETIPPTPIFLETHLK